MGSRTTVAGTLILILAAVLATGQVARAESIQVSGTAVAVPGMPTGHGMTGASADGKTILSVYQTPTRIFRSDYDDISGKWKTPKDMSFPNWATTPTIGPDGYLYYAQHTLSPYETKIYCSTPSGGSWAPGSQIAGLSGPQFEHGPVFNGTDLYFTNHYHDIWHASYDATTDTFSAASALTDLNTGHREGVGWVSTDGSLMLFSSNRPGGYGGLDLYTASWNSATQTWGSVQNLGASVNSAGDEYGFYSPSTSLLYFTRSTNGILQPMQIDASVVPEPGTLTLLGLGLVGLGWRRRRRRRRAG